MDKNTKDVQWIHDFIFLIQNLIALENHCIESFAMTKDEQQLELAVKTRHIRSKLMYRHIPESKNQIWCEFKHIMAISVSMKEMANRYYEMKETDLAKECLEDAQYMEAVAIILATDKK